AAQATATAMTWRVAPQAVIANVLQVAVGFTLLLYAACRSSAGQQEEQTNAPDQDPDAHHLSRRGPPTQEMLVRRVIAAEQFHKRTQQRITNQVSGKNLSIELLSPIKPRQSRIQTQPQQRFIDLRWMHRRSG